MLDILVDRDLSVVSHVLKTASVPEYVLAATLDQFGVDQSISDSAFAYRVGAKKSFPCHTKAACFLSRLYFNSQRPEMDSKQAELIDANLTKFASIHGIADEEFESALEAIKVAQTPVQTPNDLANAIRLITLRNKNACAPGTLIEAARELKQAGADDRLVEQWSFDTPLKNLSGIQALAVTLKSPKLAGYAEEMAYTHPRDWNSRLPEIADAIYAKTGSVDMTYRKLAGLPTQEEPDVRLCGKNFPVDKVRKLLPKIAAFVDDGVYTTLSGVPRADWAQYLESKSLDKQRQITDLFAS